MKKKKEENPESLAFAFFQFILVAAGLQFELLIADYYYPRWVLKEVNSDQQQTVDEGRGGWQGTGEQADSQSVSQADRQKQPENMGKEDLLTVFVPCGRVQPDTDLFEL